MKQRILLLIWCTFFVCFGLFAQELDYYQKAETYLQQNKFKEAVMSYQQAIKTADKSSTNLHHYHYQIANCYYKGRQAENCIKSAQKSIEIKEDFVAPYLLLARVYGKMKKTEESNQALESAFKYEKNTARKVDYMVEVTKSYAKKNDWQTALTKIEIAKNTVPKSLTANYYYAKICNQVGQHQEAKKAIIGIEDSLKLMEMKDNAKYYFELGMAYYYLKDAKNANETFKKAQFGMLINQIPKPITPEYLLSIASAYFKIHDNETTRQYVDSTLKMQNSFSKAHVMKAQLLKRESDDPSIQVESLKNAASNETNLSKKVQLYDKIAGLQIDAQQYEQCLETLEQALVLKGDDPSAWFQKAIALYRMQRFDEASKTLLTILKVTTDKRASANMQFLLGQVYKKEGNHELAKRSFQNALKSSSRNAATIELREMERVIAQKPRESKE